MAGWHASVEFDVEFPETLGYTVVHGACLRLHGDRKSGPGCCDVVAATPLQVVVYCIQYALRPQALGHGRKAQKGTVKHGVRDTRFIQGIAVGVTGGVMSGLFGIGGGTVLVPLLVLVIGLPQHRAHATSLAAIILTAGSGMARFAGDGAVNFGVGVAIAAGAIAGAFLGAAFMHRLSADRLRQGFAILLALVSLQMLLGASVAPAAVSTTGVAVVLGSLALGVVAGVLSALMGVGGGVIMVPAMVMLFGFTQHVAEGTSLLIIIPTALVGSIRHSRNGYTDWKIGLVLGIGGIAGAWLGAGVALGLDSELLQRLFAGFLLLTSFKLLRSGRPRKVGSVAPEVN